MPSQNLRLKRQIMWQIHIKGRRYVNLHTKLWSHVFIKKEVLLSL